MQFNHGLSCQNQNTRDECEFRKDSTSFRRNWLDGFGKPPVKARIHGAVLYDGAGRECAEMVAVIPVSLWPNWPRTKPAAAIRTDIFQNGFDTRPAKRAFKRADHRLRRIWRQRPIAILTSGSQFQHGRDDLISAKANPPCRRLSQPWRCAVDNRHTTSVFQLPAPAGVRRALSRR